MPLAAHYNATQSVATNNSAFRINMKGLNTIMKTIPAKPEFCLLYLISALIAAGIARLLGSFVPPLFCAPACQFILMFCYYCFVRRHIENALMGTVCEPTQKDCYNTEDESEVTAR